MDLWLTVFPQEDMLDKISVGDIFELTDAPENPDGFFSSFRF